MSNKPRVSIITISYNHEKYIRDALDGFIAQKTNFDFEVIVADDCSTDTTQKIIKKYKKEQLNMFRPILRKKNIGAWQNFVDALKSAKGEYIALCEGDDYWTDVEKLQKQVDFLEKNPDYALCFHPVRVFFENDEKAESVFPAARDAASFTVEELLRGNFIQTNSVMYRRQQYVNLPTDMMPGDWYLHLYHAQFGKIGFINKVMAAYRRHPGGIWWTAHSNKEKFWESYGLYHLAMYNEVLNLYGSNKKYRTIIDAQINHAFQALLEIDEKRNKKLLKEGLMKFPYNAETFIIDQHQEIQNITRFLQEKEIEVNNLRQKIHQQELEAQIIKSSRFWKLRNIVAKLVGKKVI